MGDSSFILPDGIKIVKDDKDDINMTEGVKFDSNKPRLSLVSPYALLELGKVAEMGARKYADNNWRKGMNWSRLLDASYRHILLYQQNESEDKESGCSHLIHAAWNLMALYEFEKTKKGNNDLYSFKN